MGLTITPTEIQINDKNTFLGMANTLNFSDAETDAIQATVVDDIVSIKIRPSIIITGQPSLSLYCFNNFT